MTKKCDTLFQQIFYLIHNVRKKTPLHVSVAKSSHDKSQSTQLIQVLNNLGMSVSYDEIETIDYNLADRLICSYAENRVPLPESITCISIIYCAMDNFDQK